MLKKISILFICLAVGFCFTFAGFTKQADASTITYWVTDVTKTSAVVHVQQNDKAKHTVTVSVKSNGKWKVIKSKSWSSKGHHKWKVTGLKKNTKYRVISTGPNSHPCYFTTKK